MKFLAVHPSPLIYAKVFLRLEPLGRELEIWRPDVVAFSLNYLANVPEVIDLAKAAKDLLPRSFVFTSEGIAPPSPRRTCCNTPKPRSTAY
jgi:hopanoid C-3 methylase